jgi:hypothetical protein
MRCIRSIKYCHIKRARKNRKLYIDDKGRTLDMKYITKFHHEQRTTVKKGDFRRR